MLGIESKYLTFLKFLKTEFFSLKKFATNTLIPKSEAQYIIVELNPINK